MIGVLSAAFLMGADRVVVVPCGQDLDATVNADEAMIGTRVQLAGGCTYTVDTVVVLNEGDEIAGPAANFIQRGPAFDPEPTVTIVGSTGVRNVIRAQGTVRLEWVKIVGGTGLYNTDGTPVAGTGSGLAMGLASNTSSLYAVHVTGSDAAGITNARGTFDRIELDDTTNNPDFLGFTGAGLKAINEVEIKNSYVHDNQGNGIWCDEFCHDSALGTFTITGNLVVNNGRAGIRWERVGDVADAGEALIENNEVHGNSPDAVRGGISVRDSQNATIQNNRFGAVTIAGVAYPPNSGNVAIIARDSGRTDRPDLFNIDIINNILNGETIKGCESPDEIVYCSNNEQPPPPPPTTATATPTVISTVPTADATAVAPTTNVTATFSEDMLASSINANTFRLFKKGSTTKLAATVSYSASTDTATLDPRDSLRNGITYKAVVTTGAKDLAGNSLDQNSSSTGSQQMVWFFTVS